MATAKAAKKVQMKDMLVRAADRRAKCVAFVNSLDKGVRVSDVMKHFNWTDNDARTTLRSLAEAKQIEAVGGGGRGSVITYQKRGLMAPALPVVVDQSVPVRRNKRQDHELNIPGIEIVIGGIAVAITKNSVTGRPRVTFEL